MRTRKRKQLPLHRKNLFAHLMRIQIPPRPLQHARQPPRKLVISQNESQQMPLLPHLFIIHEPIPRMHHAEIIKEDEVARFEDDFRGVGQGCEVQGVEGGALVGGEGREGGGARGGGRAGDAGAGAVD